MKVLHVAAEVFPLVKTGGLADVLGALPQALIGQGVDVQSVTQMRSQFVEAQLPGFRKGRAPRRLIEKKFGPVNILVNNAGVGLFTSAKDGTLKDWDWGMGVNFWGPVYGCRTFIPRMLKHGQGSHIVTTTSTDGILLGTAGIYAVSKMAVSGLMEQLRHELRATNIGTSNLVPGMTTLNSTQPQSQFSFRFGSGASNCAISAVCGALPLKVSTLPSVEMATWSPSFTSPARIISASGSCTLRWITRFSGRAP